VTPGKPRSVLNARLRLDPAALSLSKGPGGWTGKVEELFIELNVQGREVARISETKRFQIDAAYKGTYDVQGGKLTQAIPLAPGAVKLSIVVRDTASGRVGSLTIPLEGLAQGAGK
jgi:hypothetical protein